MSKKEKRLERILIGKPPCDVTFKEITTILSGIGFLYENTGGSHYMFWHKTHSDVCLTIPRPHNGKTGISRNKIREIRENIEKLRNKGEKI